MRRAMRQGFVRKAGDEGGEKEVSHKRASVLKKSSLRVVEVHTGGPFGHGI